MRYTVAKKRVLHTILATLMLSRPGAWRDEDLYNRIYQEIRGNFFHSA
jgi:hypothetical protein